MPLDRKSYIRQWAKEHPDKIKKAREEFLQRQKDKNKITNRDEVKCIRCGLVFKREYAYLNLYRMLLANKCICGDCDHRQAARIDSFY